MCTSEEPIKKKPSSTLGKILQSHFATFKEEYGHRIDVFALRKLENLLACHQQKVGVHYYQCDKCESIHSVPMSCGGSMCSHCSYTKLKSWIEARKASFPPVNYFQVVFTVPHELNDFLLANKRLAAKAIFQASSKTIKEVVKQEGGCNANPAFTLALHTWDQQLLPHFHVHGIVAAGYLLDGEWVSTDPKFYKNFKTLSKMFRNNLLSIIKNLVIHGDVAGIKSLEKFDSNSSEESGRCKPNPIRPLVGEKKASALAILKKVENVFPKVWAEPIKGDPDKIISYIATYTYKVGISNNKLALNEVAKTVTITIKQRTRKGKGKRREESGRPREVTLTYSLFILRFILHILSPNTQRFRYYGCFGGSNRKSKYAQIIESLKNQDTLPTNHKAPECIVEKDPIVCTVCNIGKLVHIGLELNKLEVPRVIINSLSDKMKDLTPEEKRDIIHPIVARIVENTPRRRRFDRDHNDERNRPVPAGQSPPEIYKKKIDRFNITSEI